MGMTGVLRPGHAAIRVLDLKEATHFYGEVLGLIEVDRDSYGRVYYRAWDERDHHSIVLREADNAGIDFFGFKVDSVATLDRLEQETQAYGLKTSRVPAGDLLQTGERVRVEIVSGHTIELYAEKGKAHSPQMVDNPPPWNAESERGIAPIRLDHALLYGPHIEKNLDFFTSVLDMRCAERVDMPDGLLAIWLTAGMKAHDLAFVKYPEPNKLHHVAFELENWNDIGNAADILTRYDISIDIGPTRHGITRGQTIYFFDPSGNRNEVFAGCYTYYPDLPTRTWDETQVGKGIFYYERKMNDAFLSVVS